MAARGLPRSPGSATTAPVGPRGAGRGAGGGRAPLAGGWRRRGPLYPGLWRFPSFRAGGRCEAAGPCAHGAARPRPLPPASRRRRHGPQHHHRGPAGHHGPGAARSRRTAAQRGEGSRGARAGRPPRRKGHGAGGGVGAGRGAGLGPEGPRGAAEPGAGAERGRAARSPLPSALPAFPARAAGPRLVPRAGPRRPRTWRRRSGRAGRGSEEGAGGSGPSPLCRCSAGAGGRGERGSRRGADPGPRAAPGDLRGQRKAARCLGKAARGAGCTSPAAPRLTLTHPAGEGPRVGVRGNPSGCGPAAWPSRAC